MGCRAAVGFLRLPSAPLRWALEVVLVELWRGEVARRSSSSSSREGAARLRRSPGLHPGGRPERARDHRHLGDSRRLGGLAQGSSVRRDAHATGRTRSGPEAGIVARGDAGRASVGTGRAPRRRRYGSRQAGVGVDGHRGLAADDESRGRLTGSPPDYRVSNTSHTFRTRLPNVNGFCNNCVPGSSVPCGATAAAG